MLVAKYLGEKDEEKANTIVANGIIVSFVVSSTVTFITMNIIRGFIMSFTSDTEIINQAMVYMDICVFMAIPCAVHICIQKVLQGTGNNACSYVFSDSRCCGKSYI